MMKIIIVTVCLGMIAAAAGFGWYLYELVSVAGGH